MANWQKFITDFSNYLASNQSTGPFDTGKKLAEYYVNTIKGTKAIPAGNTINGGIAQSFRPILDLGFGLGFFLLQNSQKSFKQLQLDKNYFDGTPPVPSNQEKKVLTEEPQTEEFSLADFFNLLKEEDFEDIRKNSGVTFRLHEMSGKKSNKIFNYKEPFNFNSPSDTRIAIFGNNLTEVKSNIASYGFMGAINTILTFNRDEDREDGQNEINERPFSSFRFIDFYNILVETLDEDPADLLDRAVRNNTGNASGTEAVKADFNILRGLYTAELTAWVDVVTPYIQRRLANQQDSDYAESGKTTPASIGISTDGVDFIPVITEGSKFPVVSSRILTTIDNFQTKAEFKIASKSGKEVVVLRDVVLENIQFDKAGIPLIDVNFTLTGSEQLAVVVTDLSTRSQDRFSISKAFGDDSYAEKNQNESYRFPPDGPLIPSNKVQEQDATKKAKDSIKGVLASLSPDLRDKLANFGLDAKIAELASKSDPYLVMSSAVVLYWTLVGLVPVCFASSPPVPPASIPTPGLFTVIFPGLPITLSKKLRLALNVGLDPAIFPEFDADGEIEASASATGSRDSAEYKSFTQAIKAHGDILKAKKDAKIVPIGVSTKLALAFATHLLSLKFIYTGATQAGPATVPTPGFVLAVF